MVPNLEKHKQVILQHRTRLREQSGNPIDGVWHISRYPDQIPPTQLRISAEQDAPWWDNMGQTVIPLRPAVGEEGADAQALADLYKTRLDAPDVLFLLVQDYDFGSFTRSVSVVDPRDLTKDAKTLEVEARRAAQQGNLWRLYSVRAAYLAVSGKSEQSW